MSLAALGMMPSLNGCALTGREPSHQEASSPEGTLPSDAVSADNLDEREKTPLTSDFFYNPQTLASDIMNDEAFGDYGRLLFPVTGYHAPDASTTLATLDSKLTWYNFYDVDTTIDVLTYLKDERLAGRQIYYPIYTAEKIAADPSKADTGLFYFRAQGMDPFFRSKF